MKVNKNYTCREYTQTLYDMMMEGLIDPKALAIDLMGWMSEEDVKEFAIKNEYIEEDEE